jgi:hypothetical protein
MNTKCTKWPNNIPFNQRINRPRKIPTYSIARPFKIYPNGDFWFENTPSGNTAIGSLEQKLYFC